MLNVTDHQGNANPNHTVTSHLLGRLLTKVRDGVGRGGTCASSAGTPIGTAITENGMKGPQKTKHRAVLRPSNLTSEHIPKGNEIGVSRSYLYSHVHCNITHNSQDMETDR